MKYKELKNKNEYLERKIELLKCELSDTVCTHKVIGDGNFDVMMSVQLIPKVKIVTNDRLDINIRVINDDRVISYTKCINKVLFRNLYDNEKMLEYIIKVIFENIKYAIIKSGE